jgi:hypothetical protein
MGPLGQISIKPRKAHSFHRRDHGTAWAESEPQLDQGSSRHQNTPFAARMRRGHLGATKRSVEASEPGCYRSRQGPIRDKRLNEGSLLMLALTAFRKYAAVSILAAFSLYHGIGLIRGSTLAYLQTASSDPISALEERFEPLKIRLSSYGTRTVGYISDAPVVFSSLLGPVEWIQDYLRIQYTLIPIILDDSPKGPYVVANFRHASSREHIVADLGLSVVEDYGNGVYLLSRDKK